MSASLLAPFSFEKTTTVSEQQSTHHKQLQLLSYPSLIAKHCAGPSTADPKHSSHLQIMTSIEATEPLLRPSGPPPRSSPPRPNYGKIHAKPFPLTAYPLPPLIPHNPLSIFHVAFTYIYRLLLPPSSHPKILPQAYFSPETRSVHVTDEKAIRVLWESGFFGKGSLSRSEPSWLDREKKNRGLIANETSEEFTAQRRAERKKFKQERARKEREAIEEKLKEEKRIHENGPVAKPTARSRYEGLNGGPVNSFAESVESLFEQQPLSPYRPPPIMLCPSDATNDTAGKQEFVSQSPTEPSAGETSKPTELEVKVEVAAIEDQEHLQLNPAEAFFLTYALGLLQVRDQLTSVPLPSETLFTLFRQHSYFPPGNRKSYVPTTPSSCNTWCTTISAPSAGSFVPASSLPWTGFFTYEAPCSRTRSSRSLCCQPTRIRTGDPRPNCRSRRPHGKAKAGGGCIASTACKARCVRAWWFATSRCHHHRPRLEQPPEPKERQLSRRLEPSARPSSNTESENSR